MHNTPIDRPRDSTSGQRPRIPLNRVSRAVHTSDYIDIDIYIDIPIDRLSDSDHIDYSLQAVQCSAVQWVIDNCVRIHRQLTNISQVLLRTSRRLEEKKKSQIWRDLEKSIEQEISLETDKRPFRQRKLIRSQSEPLVTAFTNYFVAPPVKHTQEIKPGSELRSTVGISEKKTLRKTNSASELRSIVDIHSEPKVLVKRSKSWPSVQKD